jgi:DNA adenine methylase
MPLSYSPLRYPGGKQILSRVLAHLISLNGRGGGTYAEPYAGGAGAALALLYGGHVNDLILNDADVRIFAFWKSILEETDGFLRLLRNTKLTVENWRRQRAIYTQSRDHSRLKVGFATFYLNRCNRSGIIANAGLIGGQHQTGKWKIDARFNRDVLAERIERVARYRHRIKISRFDAITFLRRLSTDPRMADRGFVYLDPPYFVKGSQLYLNHYLRTDHEVLCSHLGNGVPFKWVMSYDNVPFIRKLYREQFVRVTFNLGYSARSFRVGTELLIYDDTLYFPKAWRRRIPDAYISAAEQLSRPMPL